jgi:hypothetical protein
MSTFSDLLAAVGLAPKTLPQAKETLDTAKATLDSVAALFAAAGLNLEQLLAAGPDALKAHLDSIDNAEELATALEEAGRLDEQLTAAEAKLADSTAQLASHATIFAAVGFKPTSDASPERIKTAFEAHVSKATTLALAKTGHPPAHVPAADVAPTAKPTGAELHATWKAMKPSPERLNFFSQHEAAITAFERGSSST